MFPRYSPLEPWERRAILDRMAVVESTIIALLPGLVQAHVMVRRSEVARRNRLLTPVYCAAHAATARPQAPARLEHRLYALFAE